MGDDERNPALEKHNLFESGLVEGWQRFLAHVVEHAFAVGRRTPADFIRHFPPSAIMNALADEPKIRANMLVICAGTRQKIALKKSPASCGEDLQLALDEDETDAETIVTIFDPDDRVRFLDRQALWRYVTEGDFWLTERVGSGKPYERDAAHTAFILERALRDGLIEPQEFVAAITVRKITELVPRDALEDMVAGALAASRENRAFTERDLLAACPPSVLAENVPLYVLWEQVVLPKVAVRHKLAGTVTKRTFPPPAREQSAEDEAKLDLELDAALGAMGPVELGPKDVN